MHWHGWLLFEVQTKKIIIKRIYYSQFSYVPVIWTFHSRKLDNRVNHIHERILRLVYKDYTSSFDELLLATLLGFITVTYKNLHLNIQS